MAKQPGDVLRFVAMIRKRTGTREYLTRDLELFQASKLGREQTLQREEREREREEKNKKQEVD